MRLKSRAFTSAHEKNLDVKAYFHYEVETIRQASWLTPVIAKKWRLRKTGIAKRKKTPGLKFNTAAITLPIDHPPPRPAVVEHFEQVVQFDCQLVFVPCVIILHRAADFSRRGRLRRQLLLMLGSLVPATAPKKSAMWFRGLWKRPWSKKSVQVSVHTWFRTNFRLICGAFFTSPKKLYLKPFLPRKSTTPWALIKQETRVLKAIKEQR